MKITIENTDQIVELETAHGRVPARRWKGRTDRGIEVEVMVTRIAVPADQDQADFERELQETPTTRVETERHWQVFPSRLVL